MLAILGPAKTIDMTPQRVTKQSSTPEFLADTQILINQLKKLTLPELKSLMDLSDKLAIQNFKRIAAWKTDYTPIEGKQAMLAFSGEVFDGLNAKQLNEKDLLFANENTRIVSGLYGVLKPLDSILPFNLEMGIKMENERGKNLYDFWKNIIPEEITRLTEITKDKILINLASNEYFSAIRPNQFPFRVITPQFREQEDVEFLNVNIYAKRARGLMLRYIIKNRITSPELLKEFNLEKYKYFPDLSTEEEWFFVR